MLLLLHAHLQPLLRAGVLAVLPKTSGGAKLRGLLVWATQQTLLQRGREAVLGTDAAAVGRGPLAPLAERVADAAIYAEGAPRTLFCLANTISPTIAAHLAQRAAPTARDIDTSSCQRPFVQRFVRLGAEEQLVDRPPEHAEQLVQRIGGRGV